MASETSIVALSLLALGKFRNIRAWRNNTGQAWAGKGIRLNAGQVIRAQDGDVLVKGGRPVKFGLIGSGDIIGIEKITITSDMAGQEIGRFFSVENKTRRGSLSEQQGRFREMIKAMGGRAEVVRDPDSIEILFGRKGDEG